MLRTLLGSVLFMAAASGASAAVMTFDDIWANYGAFDSSLGDIAHLDVSNRTRNGFGNSSVYEQHIEHWRRGYSELRDVAYASRDGRIGELQFVPDSAYEVTIESFDVGTWWNGRRRMASFYIFDSDWNQIWSLEDAVFSGHSTTVSANVTGAAYFQWGSDWNVGIDNLNYSVDSNLTAVPLPASLPLLGLGLLGLGLAGRRRSQRG